MGFWESGGIVTVNDPNIIRFICQELKIDFDRAVSSINVDPLDIQPDSFAIPLCTECEKLFVVVGRIQVLMDQIKTKLKKVVSQITDTIVNSHRRATGQDLGRNCQILRSEVIQSTLGKFIRLTKLNR